MKLVKVTGSMTVEAISTATAEQFIRLHDATGDAEVTFEEVGNAPTWQTWRVTEDQAKAIDALLSLDQAEAPTVEEAPAG